MMPIAVGEERFLEDSVQVTPGEYAITITPSAELYAFGPLINEEGKGEAVTQTVNVLNGFDYGFGAAETDDTTGPDTTAFLGVKLADPK